MEGDGFYPILAILQHSAGESDSERGAFRGGMVRRGGGGGGEREREGGGERTVRQTDRLTHGEIDRQIDRQRHDSHAHTNDQGRWRAMMVESDDGGER